MAKVSSTTTMSEFISLGSSDELSYDKFSFKEVLSNDTIVSVLNVINDYMTELKELSIKVLLSDEEYRRYCYKPKLLCHEVYGNPELYFIILLLNDIADVKEFDMNPVCMIGKQQFFEALTNIFNSERQMLDNYNDSIQ